MSPKPDVSAERKQQIYQAALTCFGRDGYHRTTMDDIVSESGLSKGALYWYFGSKKELFLSMFQDAMGKFSDDWLPLIDDEKTTATDKLLASLAFFRTELQDLMSFYGVLMEAWALTRHDEDVEALTRQYYQPFLESMTQIIKQGIKSGEFAVESAEATSLVIMTLFDGLMLALGTGLSTGDLGILMDAAQAMVLYGVGAERRDG